MDKQNDKSFSKKNIYSKLYQTKRNKNTEN